MKPMGSTPRDGEAAPDEAGATETMTAAPHEPTDATVPAKPPRHMAAPTLIRGASVGPYVVIGGLGAGGMGVVYRAYDPRLDRAVALKLWRRAGHEHQDRLIDEAKTLARVVHPNVVSVYDVGVHDGSVYVAMELVEGTDARTWLDAGPRSRRDILRAFLGAGRGLAAAHRAGVIHRDFKPANMIVDAGGDAQVVDFGLARTGHSQRSAEAGSSSTGSEDTIEGETADGPQAMASSIAGTPAYMPPEQWTGGTYDARIDQFAFCVSLYRALYSQPPFAGKGNERRENVLAGRISPPPRERDVPVWLRRILVKGLSAAPGDRYPSMEALLGELGRDRARRLRRIGLAVGAVVVGVGIAVAARASAGSAPAPCSDSARVLAASWDPVAATRVRTALAASEVPGAPELAERVVAGMEEYGRTWSAMHTASCRATRVHGDQSADLLDRRAACLDGRRRRLGALVEQLARTSDRAVASRALEAVGQLEPLEACADLESLLAAAPLPVDPAVRARAAALRTQLAEAATLRALGRYDDAAAAIAPLATAAGTLDYPALAAEVDYERATIASYAGKLDEAEAALHRVLVAAARARDDRLVAQAWSDLIALIGYEQGRAADGLALREPARVALARAGSPPELEAEYLQNTGLALYSGGQPAEADQVLTRAAALRERLGDDVERAFVLTARALVATTDGRYGDAEALYRESLAIREQAYGANHPLVADSLDNLGVTIYHQGQLEAARELYDRALAVRRNALGGEHRDVGTSLNNLAGVLVDQGQLDRGREHYDRALAIWTAALGPDHPDLAIVLGNLGDLENRLGQHARAAERCERAYAIDRARYGEDARDLAYSLTCLGEARLGAGKARAAIEPLERALVLRGADHGDAAELAQTRFALARALVAAGTARARALTLARAARAAYAALGEVHGGRAQAIEAWIATLR